MSDSTITLIDVLAMPVLWTTGIFWAILFFFGHKLFVLKNPERYVTTPLRWWSGVLALLIAIGSMLSIIAYLQPMEIRNYIDQNSIFVDMLAAPVGAVIMVLLLRPRPVSITRIVLNIVPFVLVCTLGFFVQTRWYMITTMLLFSVYILAMIVYIIYCSKRYEEEIKDLYSSTYGRSVRWMMVIPVLLILLLMSYWFSALYKDLMSSMVYFVIAVVIWNFVFLRIYQTVMIKETEDTPAQEDKSSTRATYTSHREENIAEFKERMQRECVDTEFYTTPNVTRQDLAHRMTMSNTSLTNKLKEAYNMSFFDYINHLRIQKAVVMLTTTQLDILEICEKVGYAHRSSFYRAFTAAYGCSPSEYRAQHSIKNDVAL